MTYSGRRRWKRRLWEGGFGGCLLPLLLLNPIFVYGLQLIDGLQAFSVIVLEILTPQRALITHWAAFCFNLSRYLSVMMSAR